MKKLIPLMLGMALMFGAVTSFAHPQEKSTKSTKAKKAKKSTEKKS